MISLAAFSGDTKRNLYICLGQIKRIIEENSGDKILNVFTDIENISEYFDLIKEIINEILDIIDPSKNMRGLNKICLINDSCKDKLKHRSELKLDQDSLNMKGELTLKIIEKFINILYYFDCIELVWCIRFIISDFYCIRRFEREENKSTFFIFLFYYITKFENNLVYFDIFKEILNAFFLSYEKFSVFNSQNEEIDKTYFGVVSYLCGCKLFIFDFIKYHKLFIYILLNFNYYYDCKHVNSRINIDRTIKKYKTRSDKIMEYKCLEYNNNFFKMNTMSKIRVSWITAVYRAKEKRKLSRK